MQFIKIVKKIYLVIEFYVMQDTAQWTYLKNSNLKIVKLILKKIYLTIKNKIINQIV